MYCYSCVRKASRSDCESRHAGGGSTSARDSSRSDRQSSRTFTSTASSATRKCAIPLFDFDAIPWELKLAICVYLYAKSSFPHFNHYLFPPTTSLLIFHRPVMYLATRAVNTTSPQGVSRPLLCLTQRGDGKPTSLYPCQLDSSCAASRTAVGRPQDTGQCLCPFS